jgi:hypothetical protein
VLTRRSRQVVPMDAVPVTAQTLGEFLDLKTVSKSGGKVIFAGSRVTPLTEEEREYYIMEGRGRVTYRPIQREGLTFKPVTGEMEIGTFREIEKPSEAKRVLERVEKMERGRIRERGELEKPYFSIMGVGFKVTMIPPEPEHKKTKFEREFDHYPTNAELEIMRLDFINIVKPPFPVHEVEVKIEDKYGVPVSFTGSKSFLPAVISPERELDIPRKRMPLKVKWTSDEAKSLGDRLGLDKGYRQMIWKELVKPTKPKAGTMEAYAPKEIGVDLEEFRMGLEAESEHADVTGGNAISTALIALAHLREREDYYTKLKLVEG